MSIIMDLAEGSVILSNNSRIIDKDGTEEDELDFSSYIEMDSNGKITLSSGDGGITLISKGEIMISGGRSVYVGQNDTKDTAETVNSNNPNDKRDGPIIG